MKNIMITLGVLLTSVIVLAIPILFVCSIYENWPGFLKLLLLIFMSGDFLVVSSCVVVTTHEFE